MTEQTNAPPGEETGSLAGKYLTFWLSQEQSGLEIMRVRELIGMTEVTSLPRTPDFACGVINLRGNVIPEEFGESYGWYLTWDQRLWPAGPGDDGYGIAVFAQFGWAPEKRSEIAQYLGAGLAWTGALPTRDDDALGFGIFRAGFSDEAVTAEPHETVLELFYRVQLFPWLSVKADVQYIINPGGTSNKTAIPVGLRVEVVL